MKYGKYTGNQIEDVLNKIGGESALDRILAGEDLVLVERESLQPVKPVKQIVAPEFEIFRTIKRGVQKTVEQYQAAIATVNNRTSDYASTILVNHTPIAPVETEVDLVVVTPRDLKFKKEPTYAQIVERAESFGLQKCQREDGPGLRLDYQDQPSGEWLRIAMEPVTGSSGGLYVFYVVRDGRGLWLFTHCFDPLHAWDLDCQFVFVLPRKQ